MRGRGRKLAWVLAIVACLLVAGCTQRDRPDRPARDGAGGEGAGTGSSTAGNGSSGDAPPPTGNATPPPPSNGTSPPPALPHGRLERSVMADGIERHFVVHVPQQVSGAEDVPLVVMMHGTSGEGGEFYDRSRWVEEADEHGFLAVFPTAVRYCLGEDDEPKDGTISGSEYRITTKWAAGKLGTPEMPLCSDERIAQFPAARQAAIGSRTLRSDLAFFDAMLDALAEEFPLDERRVYATGFSNGGQMSARLMVDRADRFAAFHMMAGGLVAEGLASRPVPAWFSVGSMDDGFTALSGVAELPLDASLFDIPPMRGLRDALAANARVNATNHDHETRAVEGKTVATFRFDDSLAGADNEMLMTVVEDAIHQYPNGSNHPLVMANVLWAWFTQHALP